MIPGLRNEIAEALASACEKTFGVVPARLLLEMPPKVELGDLATPVAFELAKLLKRPPRKLAEELAPAIVKPSSVREIRVEGGGYVNFFFDRPRTLSAMLKAAASSERVTSPLGKIIVEHTNINPNKAAHIGHLRNAVLGDVLVRNFRRLGRTVEVQNYLDDTGVQVADVVVGLMHPEALVTPDRAEELAAEIKEILDAFPDDLPGNEPRRLGDLAWDLYTLVGKSYAADKSLEERRKATLHAIEATATGSERTPEEEATARLAARLSEAVVRCHLKTMERIGVSYDLLPRESDILARKFWVKAFDLLKAANAVHLETEGKNAGCWVMRLEGSKEFEGMEDADKILVRSNGTVTYTGKDVAYQLWKLGHLEADFEYERVPYRDMEGNAEFLASNGTSPLYRTRGDAEGADPVAKGQFGHGEAVINVIDVRQSYPQKVVKEGVRRAGFPEGADRSTHFSYEMVALTPASCEALGVELSEEDKSRPFVEMSGRKGLGVKAEDLLDALFEKAHDRIVATASSSPMPVQQQDPDGMHVPSGLSAAILAQEIATGALRVYMTRFSRNKVIAFDFEEALALEGDTGPYLQYGAVRAKKIFQKLVAGGFSGRLTPDEMESLANLDPALFDDGLWDVVRTCGRTLETFEKVAESLEVSLLVRHALAVAGAFHHLYHTHPLLKAENDTVRLVRRAAVDLVAWHLDDVLSVLGVPVPERM